jgi:ankyrin repeat protein
LFIASQDGHVEVARLLIEAGADIDKAKDNGVTPLYVASQNGHVEVARLLIEAGADIDKAADNGPPPCT